MGERSICLVTGANRGIGFEVCRQLSALGHTVVLTARDAAKANVAATQALVNPGNVLTLALEVTNAQSVRTAAEWVGRELGRLDVLINNAGGNFDMEHLASAVPMDYLRQTLEMNLIGAWQVTQALLPLIRKSKHGRIVNVSSGAGAFDSADGFGLKNMGGNAPAYAISKTALTAFTVKLATELRDTGILVNAVCPGWTATYPGGAEQGARPVADGARSVLWAATLPDDGPSGGLFRDGKPLKW